MGNHSTIFVVLLLTLLVPFRSNDFTATNELQPTYIGPRPVSSTATSAAASADLTRDASSLRGILDEVDNNLFRGQGLPRVREVSTTGRLIEGFDADGVIRIVKEGKETLNARLEKKEFAGLRSYVSKFYKVPTYDSLERVGKTKEGRTLITSRSKDIAFLNPHLIVDRIRRVANENRLAVDLRINSQPEERATYEMWSAGGERRSTVTNNTLDSVYRGLYRYRVVKSGYKTIVDDINLVDSDGRILDCTMNRTSESDGPHPCKHH